MTRVMSEVAVTHSSKGFEQYIPVHAESTISLLYSFQQGDSILVVRPSLWSAGHRLQLSGLFPSSTNRAGEEIRYRESGAIW